MNKVFLASLFLFSAGMVFSQESDPSNPSESKASEQAAQDLVPKISNEEVKKPIPKIQNSIAISDIIFKRELYETYSAESIRNNDKNKLTLVKKYLNVKSIKGLNENITSSIIRAGYKPIYIDHASQADFDNQNLNVKIEQGEFRNAQFAMVGHVIDVGSSSSKEPIQGTSDFTYKSQYSLTVNFVIVDTDNSQIIADFNVEGQSKNIYVGGNYAQYSPSSSKLISDLLKDFNTEAQKQILAHLPPINQSGIIENVLNEKKETGVGDPSTLKIYKPAQSRSKSSVKEDSDPVIIYKK